MSEANISHSRSLDKKLFELRNYVDVVKKSKSGYGYKYASIVEILAKLKAGMEKKQLLLEPYYSPGTMRFSIDHYEKSKTKPDKAGNSETTSETVHEFIVQQEMIWRWTDLETGETKDIPWAAIGEQADPSQAQGGALTYAQRQFLTQYFQIATPEDDPDNYRSKKEQAEEEARQAIVQPIIARIDAHVHAWLDRCENSDAARKQIGDLIRQYVRNGSKPTADYLNHLSDPQIAADLLAALQSKCPLDQSAPAGRKNKKPEKEGE